MPLRYVFVHLLKGRCARSDNVQKMENYYSLIIPRELTKVETAGR